MFVDRFLVSCPDIWEHLLSDRYISFLQSKYFLYHSLEKKDGYRLNQIGFDVRHVPMWIKKTFGIHESIITVDEEVEYDEDQHVMNWTVQDRSHPDLFSLCGQTRIEDGGAIDVTIRFQSPWIIFDRYISSIIFREIRSTYKEFLYHPSTIHHPRKEN